MSRLVLFHPELDGIAADMHDPDNRNLLDRWLPIAGWMEARRDRGLDPGGKVQTGRIGARASVADRRGQIFCGANFASEDSLGLGSHPKLLAAAQTALARYGVHSAGASADAGSTHAATALEARMAAFLGTRAATVFPSGWAAGYATVRALAGEGDHILIDAEAPPGLLEAALRSTRKTFRFRHRAAMAVAERLEQIRAQERDAGILVITSGLFPGNSDCADIALLRALCRRHEATLVVDVSHDLGLIGPGGRGVIGMQEMTGLIDVVTGSLARGFAVEGGFVAGDHPGLAAALRHGDAARGTAHAIAPVQAAAALAAFDIVDSGEGEALRRRLLANSRRLRGLFADAGFDVPGRPSAVVPVRLGAPSQARRMTAAMLAAGVIVNLDEPPTTPANACRWRLQVMATHSEADICAAAETAVRARDRTGGPEADVFEGYRSGQP